MTKYNDNKGYVCPACGVSVKYGQKYCSNCNTILVLPLDLVNQENIAVVKKSTNLFFYRINKFLSPIKSILLTPYVRYVFGLRFILIFLIPIVLFMIFFGITTYHRVLNYKSTNQSFYQAFSELYLNKSEDNKEIDQSSSANMNSNWPSLGGIQVGESWTQVNSDSSFEKDEAMVNGAIRYKRDDLYVYVRDSIVGGVYTKSSKYKTNKNISVGDSLSKAQEKYDNKLVVVKGSGNKKYKVLSTDPNNLSVQTFFNLNDDKKIISIESFYVLTNKDHAYETVIAPIAYYRNGNELDITKVLANSHPRRFDERRMNYSIMLLGIPEEITLLSTENDKYKFKVPIDPVKYNEKLGPNGRFRLAVEQNIPRDAELNAWAEVDVAKSTDNDWFIWDVKIHYD